MVVGENSKFNSGMIGKGVIVALVLWCAILIFPQTQAQAVSVPMPLFALQFAGNYNDSSSNSNNGVANGSSVSITTDGTRGQVATFNQSAASFVKVSTALPASFSKAAWVKLTTSANGYYNVISNSTVNPSNYMMVTNDSGGGAPSTLTYRTGHFTNASTLVNYAWDTATFTTNTWTHVAVTFDGPTKTYKLYKNGSLIQTATSSGTPLSSDSTYIGGYGHSTDTWVGSIDDAVMWNTVLTDAQITAVFGGNLGTATAPSAITNLIANSQDGQVQLLWTAPNDHGSAITDYTIEYKLSSDSSYTTFSHTPSSSASITVTGLTNKQSYDFRVKATNDQGTASDSNVATTMPLPLEFSETFDGLTNGTIANQNGWTLGGDATWAVESDGGTGKMITETVSSGKFYNAYIANGSTANNQKIKFDFKIGSTSQYLPQFWLRQSDGVGDAGGYLVYYLSGVWHLAKHTAGSGDTFTDLTTLTSPITLSTGTWYTVEASITNNGSNHPVLSMLVYSKGGSPASNSIVGSYTDTSDSFTSGIFALHSAPLDAGVSYDNLSVNSDAIPMLNFTAPKHEVTASPNTATLSITDEGGKFVIPYIQTSTTLTSTVHVSPSLLPSGGGVKFVLNSGLPSEQIVYDLTAPFATSFSTLAKGSYTLDAYVVDSGQNVQAGSDKHDSLTGIGIGDIITGIGDSITAGYPYAAPNPGNWTTVNAASVSADLRNFPQQDPNNGSYRLGYSKQLNDSLSTYYGYPVFFMNEGVSAYKVSDYNTLMGQAQWQNRQTALAPNHWLIHLGVNDAVGSVSSTTFKTNMNTLISNLITTYGATGSSIVIARPFYHSSSSGARTIEQGYFSKISELVSTYNLTPIVPDFYTYYSNYTGSYYSDTFHPNLNGYAKMAHLWEMALIKPKNVTATKSGTTITVNWDNLASLESSINGYKVKYGTVSGTYTSTTDVGNVTSKNITGLDLNRRYYFAVSAYDNDPLMVNDTLDSSEFTLLNADVASPSGGSISYSDGLTNTTSVTLTVNDGTDSETGVDSSTRIVKRRTATLTNSTCGSYGAYAPISTTGTYPTFTDSTIVSGNCYQYEYLVSDVASNQAVYTSTATVKFDNTGPTAPGTPTTTTPTSSTSQTWTWSAAVDAATNVASYSWRVTGSSTTSGTSSITSVMTSLAEGVYSFFVRGIDALGNLGLESSAGTLTVDTSAPIISSVSVTPSDTGAHFIWNTNENASSEVEYGLTTSYGVTTPETDTSSRVTSHSVNISSLVTCSTYHYRVISTDGLSHTATGSDGTFTTTGCAGSDSITSQTSSTIAKSTGGIISLTSGGTGVSVNVPADFSTADAVFQIKQLQADDVETDIGKPSGLFAIDNLVFDIKALAGVSSTITTFDHPITLTFTYHDSDLTGLDESTLVIYNYHAGAWGPLSGCVIDTSANTVSCSTSTFSDFELFGEAESTPTPTPSPSPSPTPTPTPTPSPTPTPTPTPSPTASDNPVNTSGTNSSPTIAASTCHDIAPHQTPDLFQINPLKNDAKLFFAPISGPHDRYFVSYGTSANAEGNGFELLDSTDGVISTTISSLKTGNLYYFKVRAGNGCQPGDWSNIVAFRVGQLTPVYRWLSIKNVSTSLKNSLLTVLKPKPSVTPTPTSNPKPTINPVSSPNTDQSSSKPTSPQTSVVTKLLNTVGAILKKWWQ